jgi:hypothetical protein
MIYLKSFLVGLVTLIVVPIFLVGLLVVGLVIRMLIRPPAPGGAIGWDPISLYGIRSSGLCRCLSSWQASRGSIEDLPGDVHDVPTVDLQKNISPPPVTKPSPTTILQ